MIQTDGLAGSTGQNRRKRVRDVNGNVVSVEQPQRLHHFTSKNALGATQTFQFGGMRKVGSSTSSLPSTTTSINATSASTATSSTASGIAEVIRFHARPAPSTASNRMFLPNIGRKRCTEVKEFHFHTKDRAQSRRELDAVRAESQARLRVLEEQRRQEREEKDRLEIKRLREGMVHKPIPVNIGPPFIVSASSKRLTNPES